MSTQTLPQLLRDLPTPAEVADEAAAVCRQYGFPGRYRATIEDELKVQYYFGGLTVIAARTPDGLKILAAARASDEDFSSQVKALQLGRRDDVVVLTPSPWRDTRNEVLTPFFKG